MSPLKNTVKNFFWFILIFVFYLKITQAIGFGIKAKSSQIYSEIPILFLFFCLFYFIQKNNVKALIYSALPVLVLYLSIDVNHMILGRVLMISDLLMLDELLSLLTITQKVGIVIVILLPFSLLLSNLKLNRTTLIFPSIVLLIFSLTFLFPKYSFGLLNNYYPVVSWSQVATVKKHGKAFSMMLFQLQESKALALLQDYSTNSDEEFVSNQVLSSVESRNVHIIVLESFMDIRRFEKINYKKDVFTTEFNQYVVPNINVSLSPGFGGGTAASEFEILCGVPALGLVSTIDFNVFSGSKTKCLPYYLEKVGFSSFAGHPFKPDFYNRTKAYNSLGFKDIRFGEKFSHKENDYIIDDAPGGKWLYDGSLYNQNLAIIENKIKTNNEPFISHLLTSYGHLRYARNKELRPDIQTVTDDYVNDIVNQHYYRSHEMYKYLQNLISLDPNSIIVIAGDHLPPMLTGRHMYKTYGLRSDVGLGFRESLRENFMLVIDKGEFLRFDKTNHFDLFKIILDRLSNGAYCNENDCDFGEDRNQLNHYLTNYYSLMSAATKAVTTK